MKKKRELWLRRMGWFSGGADPLKSKEPGVALAAGLRYFMAGAAFVYNRYVPPPPITTAESQMSAATRD